MTTIVNDVSDVGIYNIVADQGTTFRRNITYTTSAGAAIDFGAGATARMKVRKVTPVNFRNSGTYAPAKYILSDPVIHITSYSSAVTVSSATPGVVSLTGHPFLEGDPVYFTAATMPTGLTANTVYYVKYVNSSTFQLAATPGGSALATSSTGTSVVVYKAFDLVMPSPVAQVAVSSASPGVVTFASHPFAEADAIYFSAATMPTGLTAGTVYYVKYVNSSTFQIAATPGGTAINTSSTGASVLVYRASGAGVVSIIIPSSPAASSVAVSSANPAVVTFAGHPFVDGNPVYFTAATMPTGLTANTIYYVKYVNSSTFQLSATKGGASIATSSTGTTVVIYEAFNAMSAVPADIYDYDLEVVLGSNPGIGRAGEVVKLVRGLFEVRFEVSTTA